MINSNEKKMNISVYNHLIFLFLKLHTFFIHYNSILDLPAAYITLSGVLENLERRQDRRKL